MMNAKTLRECTNAINNGMEMERLEYIRTICDEMLLPAMAECAKHGEYDYQTFIEPWNYNDVARYMRAHGYKVTCIGATPVKTLFIVSWHN